MLVPLLSFMLFMLLLQNFLSFNKSLIVFTWLMTYPWEITSNGFVRCCHRLAVVMIESHIQLNTVLYSTSSHTMPSCCIQAIVFQLAAVPIYTQVVTKSAPWRLEEHNRFERNASPIHPRSVQWVSSSLRKTKTIYNLRYITINWEDYKTVCITK